MRMDSDQLRKMMTRRHFCGRAATGIGTLALASLLTPEAFAGDSAPSGSTPNAQRSTLHFPPKAKRVIYLFQSGGPSHLDLFDYKPRLRDENGKELPES